MTPPAFASRAGPPLAVLAGFTLVALAMFAPVVFDHQWFVWDVPD